MLLYTRATIIRPCICVGIVRPPSALRSCPICQIHAPTQLARSLAIGHGSSCRLMSSHLLLCKSFPVCQCSPRSGAASRLVARVLCEHFAQTLARPFAVRLAVPHALRGIIARYSERGRVSAARAIVPRGLFACGLCVLLFCAFGCEIVPASRARGRVLCD